MISNPANKLVFSNTSTVSILFTMLLSSPFIFFGIYLTFGDLISSLSRLNKASLNCSRDKSEIYCSLTGKNSYGNIEQVISSKQEKWIGIRREISDNENEIDDLIVLVTNKKEIFLFTQKSIIKGQIDQLNSFLYNPTQNSVKIDTRRSDELNIFSKSLFLAAYWDFCCVITIVFIIKSIVNSKKYTFDKENNRITIKRVLRKDLSFEIEFKKIKQVNLALVIKSDENMSETILLIDNNDFVLLSIDLYYTSRVHYTSIDMRYTSSSASSAIADSICLFLYLEPYQTTVVPP
ncbi:hypothetical protein H6F42_20510 [Pseudanabaena sp. FACHB-1998]|uniref:hypothetical protein n=1 Tax=Pseudanabaena sp. FACHB-1998 TaxID=2692858 RepID=UPI001680FDE2|nr:hypothetical protein [Pseudanabaena sp. FACHB-1998]MBD2179310.1 hypothetical protein [Pseudanabaena sp. FACHB-1998]